MHQLSASQMVGTCGSYVNSWEHEENIGESNEVMPLLLVAMPLLVVAMPLFLTSHTKKNMQTKARSSKLTCLGTQHTEAECCP